MKAQLSLGSVLLASAGVFNELITYAAPVAGDEPSESGLLVGRSIVEPSPEIRNVFPATNFNRNVSTNWWDTEVLDGAEAAAAMELKATLEIATIIVLNRDMYKVYINSSPLNCVQSC